MEKSEKKPKNKLLISCISIGILVVILLIFSVIFSLINIGNNSIIGKVSIMGIDVSNMTNEEAIKALEDVINNKVSEELILKKEDYETSINANQINAQYDIEGAVKEAYDIGRNGNIITNI